jgi:hypothetical protein
VPLRQQAAQQINALGGAHISSSDIIFQGSYTHAGATLEGLWGPVPLQYLQEVQDASVAVLSRRRTAPGRRIFRPCPSTRPSSTTPP